MSAHILHVSIHRQQRCEYRITQQFSTQAREWHQRQRTRSLVLVLTDLTHVVLEFHAVTTRRAARRADPIHYKTTTLAQLSLV